MEKSDVINHMITFIPWGIEQAILNFADSQNSSERYINVGISVSTTTAAFS